MKSIILLFSFFLSIVPVIFFGFYFYKKDTIKEPKLLLSKLFLSGILTGIIVIIISIFGLILFPTLTNLEKINNIIILLFYTYIFIALIEEFFKFLMIYQVSYNNKEFNQAYDIILYSIFVGLGFACFENIIYIIENPSVEIAILRGITAVPAHVCFQTLMGYYLYLSKTKEKNKNILLSLVIPIFLHGTYDFFIFTGSNILILGDLGLLITLFFLANSKIKKLIEIDKINLKQLCPNCGTKINYKYCPNCGYKKQ